VTSDPSFWVVDAMLEVGVPFHILFHLYDNLLDRTEGDHALSILFALAHILQGWQQHLAGPDAPTDELPFYRNAQVETFLEKKSETCS